MLMYLPRQPPCGWSPCTFHNLKHVDLTKVLILKSHDGLCVIEQGWLGAKDNIIHAGEGPIPIIRWAGTLVAWANNVCVRVKLARRAAFHA